MPVSSFALSVWLELSHILYKYGLLGFFVISYVMSLVFIPGGPELLLPALLYLKFNPNLVFIIMLSGSVLGAMTNYYIGRGVARAAKIKKEKIEKILSRALHVKEGSVVHAKKFLDKWQDFAIFIASILPPPFPFDVFTVVVGFLRMDSKLYLFFMALGKALQYSLIILLLKYGIRFLIGG